MNESQWKKLFDYIESQNVRDGVITKDELKLAVGPDLDNDGVVTNKKLYRHSYQTVSKYTGNIMTVYEYSTEEKYNFTPYIVDNVHVSEQDLSIKTNNKWLENFNDVLDDHLITWEEFLSIVQQC